MSSGRREDAWDRMSALLSLTFNINRGKNVKAKSPVDFNPFTPATKRKTEPIAMMKISDMKEIFMGLFRGMHQAAKPGLIGGGTVPVNPADHLPGLKKANHAAGPHRSIGTIQ